METYFGRDVKHLTPDDAELTVAAVGCFLAGAAFTALLLVALAV